MNSHNRSRQIRHQRTGTRSRRWLPGRVRCVKLRAVANGRGLQPRARQLTPSALGGSCPFVRSRCLMSPRTRMVTRVVCFRSHSLRSASSTATSVRARCTRCASVSSGRTRSRRRTTTSSGVLSLIIYSLLLVISIKYVAIVMRADNQGEGGVLALTALIPGRARAAAERRGWPSAGRC